MKLICFDCDSTLSSVEGIDELARLRGPEAFARVEAMTQDAMNGKIPLESVYGYRLDYIKPTTEDVAAVGRRYVATVEPTAKATIEVLEVMGWTPIVISGGFRQTIRPLADFLKIGRVEAVDLFFADDGTYKGFDSMYPATRTGGKAQIIAAIREEFRPDRVVMVGDGVSDLETKPVVDLFIGYGGFATRERVKREAAAFVTALSEVPALL